MATNSPGGQRWCSQQLSQLQPDFKQPNHSKLNDTFWKHSLSVALCQFVFRFTCMYCLTFISNSGVQSFTSSFSIRVEQCLNRLPSKYLRLCDVGIIVAKCVCRLLIHAAGIYAYSLTPNQKYVRVKERSPGENNLVAKYLCWWSFAVTRAVCVCTLMLSAFFFRNKILCLLLFLLLIFHSNVVHTDRNVNVI